MIHDRRSGNQQNNDVLYYERAQSKCRYQHDSRTIYKIGVNFSTKTRRIEGWKKSYLNISF